MDKKTLVKLAAPYGLPIENAAFLNQSQNVVYRFDSPAGCRVLRIAADRHQPAGQVEAELHWINRLSDAGFRVNKPVATSDGQLVCEQAIDGKSYITACFEYVPGKQVLRKDADEAFFVRLGSLTGREKVSGTVSLSFPQKRFLTCSVENLIIDKES